MDNKEKYECTSCGEIKEVEAGAEAPVCDGCQMTMTPVKDEEETIGVEEVGAEIEGDEEEISNF